MNVSLDINTYLAQLNMAPPASLSYFSTPSMLSEESDLYITLLVSFHRGSDRFSQLSS